MKVKSPKTYDEQVEILRNRGCVITDDVAAVEFLKRTNYYRFSGYLVAFKQPDDIYVDDTNFERVASIYTFDQNLRGILTKAVGEIEVFSKSMIAYHHAHKYGSLGYLNADNFNKKHNHELFVEQFDSAIRNNKSTLFVKHHIKKYEGNFPIWVAIELFTMGMTSLFYADLKIDDKKAIAKEFNTDYVHLESWLHNTTVLRNICAHYGRLYNVRYHQSPKLPREYAKFADTNMRSLFKQLYMLKLLYSNFRNEWNNSIVTPLSALVEKHEKHLDLKTMGFPVNWKKALLW